MERKKQIDYRSPSNKHTDYDYEFAYELGAEIMQEKMDYQEEYMKKLNQRNQNRTEMGQDLDQNKKQQQDTSTDLEIAKELDEDCQIFNTQNFYNRQHCEEPREVLKNNAFENQQEQKRKR